MKCKICENATRKFDSEIILGKYNVYYYHCSECGFVQTEEPYWLEEAYFTAITSFDTGIMMRNFQNAASLVFLMHFIKDSNQDSYLDFGGGYGVLTRIMRDYGFDFYNYDKYAQNLFSCGFDGDLTKKYKLVTAFENFEHFVDPHKEIENIFSVTDTLYFSTLLLPVTPPPINTWWYYALDGGQHISFYSRKTLEFIANKHNMYFLSNNIDTHIISKRKINKYFFKFLKVYKKVNSISITKFFRKKPKTRKDMDILLQKLKGL